MTMKNTAQYVNKFNKKIIFTGVSGAPLSPEGIRAICDGKIYQWNPNASGYPGCISHGGNFLHGTEFSRASSGGGAWEREKLATADYITYEYLYPANDVPTIDKALKLLENCE